MPESTTQSHVRGLQFQWVKEHSFWIFVWCADDGDLDRNHRLCYSCVSSPSEFTPQGGQFILTKETADADYTFVYGVPYHIYSVGGSIKIYFTDLTPALGNPRFATGEDSADTANAGKSGSKFGWCLEGQLCKEDLTNGPILWNLKDQNLHNNPSPVLEVSDIDSVASSINQFGAPCGALVIEYQRDATGRIITDDNGLPKIAQIDNGTGSRANTAQNFKIGYLALKFVPDYFGIGLHGWIGAGADAIGPFDFTSIDGNGALTIYPGTVNGMLPDSPLETVDCSGQDFTYVYIDCNTDSNQVNQCQYKADGTKVTPPPAVKGAPPPTFKVLLGFVTKDNSSTPPTYKLYKTWPKNANVLANPLLWIETDKDDPQPFQTPQDLWYSWQLQASIFQIIEQEA